MENTSQQLDRHNWYAGGLLAVWHHTVNILESLDQYWAFRITLKNLFQPLYQDQTILGRILGFIFRSFRLLISGILYVIIILLSFTVYVCWAAIPVYILYRGLQP